NPPLLRIISQISSEEIDANLTPGDASDDVAATESLTSILNILLTPIGPELGAPSTNDVNVDNDGVPVDTAVAHEGFFAGRTPAEILLDIVAQMLERSEKDPRDYDVADRTLPDWDGNTKTDVNANRTLLRIILDGLFDDPNVDDPSLNDQIDDYPGNECADEAYADANDGAAGLEPTCDAGAPALVDPSSGVRGPLGGDGIAVPQRALDILPELLNTMARYGFDDTNAVDGEPLTTIFENCDSTTVGETCPANNGYPDQVPFSGNHRLLSNARTGIDIALQLDQPLQVGAGNVCGEGLLCFEESLLREAIESISNLDNTAAVNELLVLVSLIEEDIAPINMSTSIPNPQDVSRAASAVRALADPDGDGDPSNDGVLSDLIPIIQVIPASGQTQQIIDLLRAVRGAGYDNTTDPARDIRGGELLKAQEDVLLSMLDAYSGATDELSIDGGGAECPGNGGIGATGGILDSVPAGLNTSSTKGVLVGGDNGATTGAGVFVDDTKDFAALGAGAGADLCIRTVINPFTEACSQISAQPVGDTILFTDGTPDNIDAYLGANCQATTAVAGENFVGVG
ncbi:MAG: hypothetical protein KDH09_00240, partial [Chrysiogenetes bacterium]|nr:hypothetical protein [Chrysiogenetes bacterium]